MFKGHLVKIIFQKDNNTEEDNLRKSATFTDVKDFGNATCKFHLIL